VRSDEIEHLGGEASRDAHARDFFWGLDVNGHGRTRVSPVLQEISGERFVFQGLRILVQIGRGRTRRVGAGQRLESIVFPVLK